MENGFNVFVFLLMLFCHVFDDYILQGILANMKQKSWWKEMIPGLEETMYVYDYRVALITHAFSWTFMIMLPTAILASFNISLTWIILFGVNWFIHAIVDDLKANQKVINLIQDQTIHFVQLLITWAILVKM